MQIKIIGNGVFGKAMLSVLKTNSEDVSIAQRDHKITDAEIVVLCVPTQALREVLPLINFRGENKIIVNTAKGIERNSHEFPYQIVNDYFGKTVEYFSLMGPSFAQEIMQNMPTLVNIGYKTGAIHTQTIKKLFQTNTFRVRLTEGVEILEIASAMKNIYAIGCGMAEGIGYSENTKAILLTLAIEEMQEYFRKRNFDIGIDATAGTIGDLILTCASHESRNFRFGKYLVQFPVELALQKVNSTVEGYNSLVSLALLQQQSNVKLPLAAFIAEIVQNRDRNIRSQFEDFLKQV